MSAKKATQAKAPKAKKATGGEAAATAKETPVPTAPSPSEAPAKTKAPKAKAEPKPKKVSALDAAAKVLGEQGKPMTCQEMIEEMSRKKYWSSPNGATPQATLYAAILREIKVKGKEARFQKTDRGKFASAK
jgi:vancomycin resistance protein YoaR